MSTIEPPTYPLRPSEIPDGSPPPRYVQPPSHRPVLHPPTCPVPVVDLSLLLDPELAELELVKLHSALARWGFFHVVGHGIPRSSLDNLLRLTREFFGQAKPASELKGLEGYGADGVVSDEQVLDWAERLYLQVQPQRDRKMELWPKEPESYTEKILEYSGMCMGVAERVFKAMARALRLEDEVYFVEAFGEEGMVYERFNYYPHCATPEMVIGIKPHCDASAITFVLQDPEVEGLHVLDEVEDRWLSVPIVPGALLVNIGDQMEIMSNGIYKSPLHRVVVNTEKDRVSVVSFYSMGMNKEIGPSGVLVGEVRPRMYRSITVKDYLENFYKKFPFGERAIDYAKM